MIDTRAFLDQYGLKYFATQIATKMDSKIYNEFETRLTQVVNDQSGSDEFPSAAAVWEAIEQIVKDCIGVNFVVVDNLPPAGEPGTIYLMKVDTGNPDDNVYSQWIYQESESKWINLGSTKCDISNLWNKDELVPMSNSDINDILTEVWPDWVPPDPGP